MDQGRVRCTHGGHSPLKGRRADGSWRTSATAAYAPEFCRAMARALLLSELEIDLATGPRTGPTQAVGAKAAPFAAPEKSPSRILLSDITSWDDKDVVYIGRGSSSLSLKKSKWGNPFKIAEGCTREVAVSRHADWLKAQPELL